MRHWLTMALTEDSAEWLWEVCQFLNFHTNRPLFSSTIVSPPVFEGAERMQGPELNSPSLIYA